MPPRLVYLQDHPIWILWRLWRSRNILIFQRKVIPWRISLQQSKTDAKEWYDTTRHRDETMQIRVPPTTRSRSMKWKRPPNNWMKINVDGGFQNNGERSKAGWVIRDHCGNYHGSVQAVGKFLNNPLESEMQAILMAIQHAWSRGYQTVCIESDCRKAVDIINGRTLHFDVYNWKREIIWWKAKFQELKIQWIGRDGNKVADKLVKHHFEDHMSFKFHFYVPWFITSELHKDYVTSS